MPRRPAGGTVELTFSSQPERSQAASRHPARRPGDAHVHGYGLQQAGTQEPPRAAAQVEERRVREPLIDPPGPGASDCRTREASPLDRRVDYLDDRLEQLRVGILRGDRGAEPGKRGRVELRQLDLQRQVRFRQAPELLEELAQLDIRTASKLPGGLRANVGEKSPSQALLARTARYAAAVLRLATGATGTRLVTPDLRHD